MKKVLYLTSMLGLGYFLYVTFTNALYVPLPISYEDCVTKQPPGTYKIFPGLMCSVTYTKDTDTDAFRDCYEYGGYRDAETTECTMSYIKTGYTLPQNYDECLQYLPPGQQTQATQSCELKIEPRGPFDRQAAKNLINQCWKQTGYEGAFGQDCTFIYTHQEI